MRGKKKSKSYKEKIFSIFGHGREKKRKKKDLHRLKNLCNETIKHLFLFNTENKLDYLELDWVMLVYKIKRLMI